MALTKITTNIIEDDAITADKIAAGAINSTHITGISTSDIAEGTNLYYTSARFDTAFSGKSTTDLAEGTNLYYTDARFDTRLATKSTSDLAEGTNLYWTTARGDSNFATNLAASDTDDLSEGATNFYYTDARFDTRLATKSTTDLVEGTNLYYTDSRVASYLTANTYATESYVTTAISNLVDAAPATLDTLNELAAALGDDANFSTTVTNSIATKWTQDNTKISNWDTAYGWGDHASAGYLTGNQTITLTGDASGSGTTSIAVTIADDSHNHIISNVDGLQTALDAKQDSSTALTTSTTFGGDVSGTYNAIVVADDSHNHIIGNVDGLQTALDGKLGSGEAAVSADKWTTARTVSLTGAVTGSASVDGSANVSIATTHTADPTITLTGAVTGSGTMTNLGNVSIATTATADPTLTLAGDASGSATFTNLGNATLTVTVANDSHTHDGRYYTETESDARYVQISGGAYNPSGGSISTASHEGSINYVYNSTGGTPTRGDCSVHAYQQWSNNLSLSLTSSTWQTGDIVRVSNVYGGVNITVSASRIYTPDGSFDTSVTFNNAVGGFVLAKYTSTTGYWMVMP